MPPARLTGPVCTASIPMVSNTRHRSSPANVQRNDSPGLVIIEMGYAVNQTDAFSIAARGFEWANGRCDMPEPANWEATAPPRASIDSCCNQST